MTIELQRAEEDQAVLLLVQRLLDTAPVATEAVQSYDSLRDGRAFYVVLHRIAPQYFDALTVVTGSGTGEEAALRQLIGDMNVYARSALGPPAAFDLVQRVSLPSLLRRGAAAQKESVDALAATAGTSGTASRAEEDGGDDAFALLTELFVVMVVLSGVAEMMHVVRALPRDTQVHLSTMAKRAISRHGLKPVRRAGSTSSGMYSAPPAAPHFSPSTSLATPASASPTAMRAGSLDGTVHEPAVVDESYYRNATTQLRRELAEVKVHAAELEAVGRRAQEERQSWESRYRHLLADQQQQLMQNGGTLAAGEEGAAETARQRLAQKDATIKALASKVEEQSGKLSEFREAMTMQEAALQCMKRKLKYAEEDVVRRAAERRDALEKLAVAEDKLGIQVRARAELEAELEQVQSQLTLLQVHQLSSRDAEGGEAVHDANATLLQSSFASNASVDRVVQLENDLEKLRAERDALQRQLDVLQRQIAALPEPVADATAAADTWRAQLRQVEQERDDLHQQLNAALAHLEQLQRGAPDAASAMSEVAGTEAQQGPQSVDVGAAVTDAAERRVRQARESALRHQALLSSMLLQYGYDNLLLRQHQALFSEHHHHYRHYCPRRRHGEAAAMQDVTMTAATAGPQPMPASGSILTRQRRMIERGLLDSVIHSSRQTY